MIITNFEAVGKGWRPLLERLNQDLLEAVGTARASDLRVLQIKEKFGGLRVYLDCAAFDPETRATIDRCVRDAEHASFRSCEECGEPGVPRTPHQSRYGWVKVLCETHHAERDRKYQYVPTE